MILLQLASPTWLLRRLTHVSGEHPFETADPGWRQCSLPKKREWQGPTFKLSDSYKSSLSKTTYAQRIYSWRRRDTHDNGIHFLVSILLFCVYIRRCLVALVWYHLPVPPSTLLFNKKDHGSHTFIKLEQHNCMSFISDGWLNYCRNGCEEDSNCANLPNLADSFPIENGELLRNDLNFSQISPYLSSTSGPTTNSWIDVTDGDTGSTSHLQPNRASLARLSPYIHSQSRDWEKGSGTYHARCLADSNEWCLLSAVRETNGEDWSLTWVIHSWKTISFSAIGNSWTGWHKMLFPWSIA